MKDLVSLRKEVMERSLQIAHLQATLAQAESELDALLTRVQDRPALEVRPALKPARRVHTAHVSSSVNLTGKARDYFSAHPETNVRIAELCREFGVDSKRMSNAVGYLLRTKVVKRVSLGKYRLRAAASPTGR